ncbi:antibiotic biosynthesis monooxygenase family protein [Pseudarthrobacter sulfonivorans]|jgi:heme-degrading monooxygenase HmoA|uniref:antibiotic biosynthesis monooxygenase family protein n=1 Tax=Pseudarthrobacter sulfonivorans TaxID=121292 RepID=UPI002781B228|nr:antibiotic biosynthesis monooxygenase family protein [Pseudarthrobacter sulfonivorans]MDQ0000621.1 heme-degrading monooxygenase HmoA [Pseudarthrobacter sulfonivorans]
MVLEVADIQIEPDQKADFEAAVALGLDTVLSKSPGFVSYEIQRCKETPERYLLLIEWQKIEDHTVGFRESDAYAEWSAIVRPFFAKAPHVEHFDLIGRKPAEG